MGVKIDEADEENTPDSPPSLKEDEAPWYTEADADSSPHHSPLDSETECVVC